MPMLSSGRVEIDYTEDGVGEMVVLIHSSISGNRQWLSLVAALKDRYRVLAPNLFGYGATTVWSGDSAQTLSDQASLVLAICGDAQRPIHLVGHSFGGSVALKAASLLGRRVGRLVLLEPNPFYLLKQHGRREAFAEALALRDLVKHCGTTGEWLTFAERFADYWAGDGSWGLMPEKRRQAFVASWLPNFHEWDAVMNEHATIDEWKALTTGPLVVSAAGTRQPIREIVEILAEAYPQWTFVQIPEGGHMAPLTHPEVVNPIVRQFLDSGRVTPSPGTAQPGAAADAPRSARR